NVAHKATLWGFFVEPEYRHRGIGTALVAAAMHRAAALEGLHHVRLVLTSCDHAARHVFASQGFEQFGLEAAGIRLDGLDYDQVFMLRKL
ncbi:MAG TPA: GNAT family N-acetyltransferase, partial [Candidatus Obscuribacterales bacterium]